MFEVWCNLVIDLGTAEWLGIVGDREHTEEVLEYIYNRRGGKLEVKYCLFPREEFGRCLVFLTSDY
jgi:hypothetical protein